MSQYAAILGHQPHISVAELAAATEGFALTGKFQKMVALFDASTNMDFEMGKRLGGSVAIARKIKSSSGLTLEDLPKIVANETKDVKGKITFSLRTYGIPPKELHTLYRDCKKQLKKAGRPSRYIGTDRKPAAAVLLHDSGVLTGEHGAEIFVIVSKEPLSGSKEELSEPEVWIGRTVYAQDIESYSKRDMEKPARDTTVGLLPPKLAQILLNFGHWMVQGYGLRVTGYGKTNQKPETRNQKLTVLDPFCGTGVIPMEALLRKWNVVASDLSLKAANACERNCDWIRKEEKILKRDVESVILKHDATKPFPLEKLPKNLRPDLIVTETTLGPPLASRPTIKDAQKLKTENEKIQAAFLRSAAEVFPRVPIVCTWPVWYHSKGQIHLEKIWETLHEIGYRATLPPGIESDVKDRLSLVYRRPDQFVGREILLLQPKK